MFDTDDSRSDPGLIAAIWTYRWSIIAFVMAAAVGAYALSDLQQRTYSATAAMVLQDPRDPGLLNPDADNRYLDPERFYPQQAQRAESPVVLQAASDILGGGVTVDELDTAVGASAVEPLNTIEVTATLPDPQEAARYANAVAEAYQTVASNEVQEEAARAIQALQEQIIALRDEADAAEAAAAAQPDNAVVASRANILTERIIALEARAGDVAAQAAVRDSGVDTFLPAEVPDFPSAPLPLRNAAIAAFLAGVIGALVAYRRSLTDDNVRNASEVAEILKTPLLGEVPRLRKSDRASWFSVGRPAAEAYRFVLASIQYQLADFDNASVLITSANPGDGKSLSALQLSLAARHDGSDVVLVDGDVRMRGLTTLLQSEDRPGLTNVLEGSSSLDEVLRRYRFEDDLILPVVTSGDGNAQAPSVAGNRVLTRTLQTLRTSADLVVVDSPPLLAVAETTVLANNVDGIVLVVSSGVSRKQLRKLSERLAFVTTPVLGYIFNRAADEPTAYGYGYADHGRERSWLGGRRAKAAPQHGDRVASANALSGSDTPY